LIDHIHKKIIFDIGENKNDYTTILKY